MMFNRLAARTATGVLLTLIAFVPNSLVSASSVAMAQSSNPDLACTHVGGALMTNIGVVAGVTNLGPVFGDLAGSVAATILGQNANGTFNVQHYWVTAAGDTLKLKVAVLTPTFPSSDKAVVAVPWGNYRSDIAGGTGKFANASGYIDYFGIADFGQGTLVLRYRGEVCTPRER
jgi:hypothetical protein